ncbi:MAG: helix-turn-helix domain-containing protein [Candidatus Accumulibacter sp.]|jgi:predicted XRE-type DNA-binding protein|nr:helix-turn-helix domain-containing protein [Accumulibacter sp.]
MKKEVFNGVEIWHGSGNVYADLGFPDAEKMKIKAGMVMKISDAMHRLGLTQQEAAARMGRTRPKVSGMLRGDFSKLSSKLSERKLMDCLNRLDYNIEIKVQPSLEPVGRLTLVVA